MDVPMLDLKLQYDAIRQDVVDAVGEVLETQLCCNGPAVRELEKRLGEYCGAAAAVGVSSGTDALLCSLMALEIGPGDEVIVPTFSFFATAGCVSRVGATPVFVDIEPDTFNLDPDAVADAVSDATAAVIPVHLYGQMAEMAPIMKAAGRSGLAVIEDAAQSVGAAQNGRAAGSVGTTGCLSFYPTKNLGACGDGGMILTNDTELAEKLAIFRNHGESSRYHHKWVGGNFRLDTIQAAVLNVKLDHLDAWTAARAANATLYDELLGGVEQVTVPTIREHNSSVYNQYVIRAERRDELQSHLKENGIGSGIYYPLCLHEQECFAPLGYKRGDFPVAEQAAGEVLALPIFPELSEEQIRCVAGQIGRFYA